MVQHAAPNKGTTILLWFRSPKTVLNPPVNGKIQGLFKAFECFQVLFEANLIFKDFSRQSCIFKYFSSLCEPCACFFIVCSFFFSKFTFSIIFFRNNIVLPGLIRFKIVCKCDQQTKLAGKELLATQKIAADNIFKFCHCIIKPHKVWYFMWIWLLWNVKPYFPWISRKTSQNLSSAAVAIWALWNNFLQVWGYK